MDDGRLASALQPLVGAKLAADLSADFVKMRHDLATRTLERATIGKFVETFVQCLQEIATGNHDSKPDVDLYLSKSVENETALPEGLRIVAARAARLIYTLRNKRSIAHKNAVDPNIFDLALAHQSAAWVMAELVRNATGVSMAEAGVLIQQIEAPVGPLVEDIDGLRLVHANVDIRSETLILLHSRHPDRVALRDVFASMFSRDPGSIRNRMADLRKEKLVVGDAASGFRLTQQGFAEAVQVIQRLALPDKISTPPSSPARRALRRRSRSR
jgi:hypothetical protein